MSGPLGRLHSFRAGNIDVKLGAYGIDATKGVASRNLSDPTAAQDTAYGTLVDERNAISPATASAPCVPGRCSAASS